MGTVRFSIGGRGGKAPLGCAGRIGGSLFFLVFLGMGVVFCALLLRELWKDAQTRRWPAVACTIIESRIERQQHDSAPYSFIVRYSYDRAGRSYSSETYQRGGFSSGDYAAAQRRVLAYPVESEATCYVNPQDATDTVLVHRSLWHGLFLPLPLIFVVIGAIGMWSMARPSAAATSKTSPSAAISQGAMSGKGWMGMLLFFSIFLAVGAGTSIALFILPALHAVQARSWRAVPCTVISSAVQRHSGEDGDTYSVDILFEYRIGTESHRSNRYDFAVTSRGSYESKQRTVRQYPPQKSTTCYVDPADPTRAVLKRQFNFKAALLFFGLFSVPFLGIGVGGIIYTLRRARRSGGSAPGPSWMPRLIARPSAGPTARRDSGAVVLRSRQSPLVKLTVAILIASFWNGIVSIFIISMIDGWRRGHGNLCLTAFLIPFEAIGLIMIGAVGYCALACFNPRLRLSLGRPDLRLGDSTELRWACAGRYDRIERLRIRLEGREEATYRRGTTTTTDKNTFARIDLAEITQPFEIASGRAMLTLPADTMHSLAAPNNKIIWAIIVHGQIGRWPDIKDEYEIPVLPRSVAQGARA